MENNCLVTKLKGSASGNLPLFNKIGFKIPIIGDKLTTICSFRQIEKPEDAIHITSNVVTEVFSSTGSKVGNIPVLSRGNLGVYVKNISKEGTLWIDNLQNLTRIVMDAEASDDFDIYHFIKCAVNLSELIIIHEISDEPINITLFAEIKNLTSINLGKEISSVYGDIKDFADALYNKGKTSGTINIVFAGPNIINSVGNRATTLSFSSTGWKEAVK